MILGSVLRSYRLHKELSLRKLGAEIGLSAATLHRLESGLEISAKNLSVILRWLL